MQLSDDSINSACSADADTARGAVSLLLGRGVQKVPKAALLPAVAVRRVTQFAGVKVLLRLQACFNKLVCSPLLILLKGNVPLWMTRRSRGVGL